MILKQAIDHYGVEHQLNKVQEELGELITAISKWRNDKSELTNIIDEMADAKIMYNQLTIILNKYYQSDNMKSLIQYKIDYKLNRLKQRIEDDKSTTK